MNKYLTIDKDFDTEEQQTLYSIDLVENQLSDLSLSDLAYIGRTITAYVQREEGGGKC